MQYFKYTLCLTKMNKILSCSMLTFSVTFLLLVIRWLRKKPAIVKASSPPPEPAGSLPIIGHLPLFSSGSEAPHKTLARLADKYGPIFRMRLGVRQVVVISNMEMAKECLLTNDKDLGGRPKILAFELLTNNSTIFGFSPVSPYWRDLKKIATFELLSSQHMAAMLKQVEVSEVRAAIKRVYDKWVIAGNRSGSSSTAGYQVSEEMRHWFGNVAMNIILNLVIGKSLRKETDMADKLLKALRDFHLAGVFTISDALPYIRWLDVGGCEKFMKKTARDLDAFAHSWLQSHRTDQAIIHGAEKKKGDFMDLLISKFDAGDAKTYGYDEDIVIKSTCLTMILAGTEPTSVTVTWALCLLLTNPETLKKAQEELDIHVGRERMLEESDINNLVYLHAVIKETLRLHPPVPLSVPHESTANVVVGGYHIPAGTVVITNLHKIHRDPLVWDDPCTFKPERFLTTHDHINFKTQQYELIPFSAGRRSCPGKSYGLRVMPFMLASLLHSFEIATPSDTPIDMTETGGLTSLKSTPLEVILTPRLPHHLYEIDH